MDTPLRAGALKMSDEVVVEPLGGTPITQPNAKAAWISEETDMDKDGRTNGEEAGVSGVGDGVGVVSETVSDGNSFPQDPSFLGEGLVGDEFGPAGNVEARTIQFQETSQDQI